MPNLNLFHIHVDKTENFLIHVLTMTTEDLVPKEVS